MFSEFMRNNCTFRNSSERYKKNVNKDEKKNM